jgi:citrate synthase
MIDIRNLYAHSGMFTFDPGYTATGSCVSQITYIDGDKGELWFRGYPIEDVANHCSFMECCFLLLYGDLPSKSELNKFEDKV